MKVTIIEKNEDYIVLRIESKSTVEGMMLSFVSEEGGTEVDITMFSGSKPQILLGNCYLPVKEIAVTDAKELDSNMQAKSRI